MCLAGLARLLLVQNTARLLQEMESNPKQTISPSSIGHLRCGKGASCGPKTDGRIPSEAELGVAGHQLQDYRSLLPTPVANS